MYLLVSRALTGKYPPKIRMYSKYERRTDTRTYDDRRKLYEGGWDVLYTELLEKSWKEKMDEWTGRAKCECQAVKYKPSYKPVSDLVWTFLEQRDSEQQSAFLFDGIPS